VQDIPIMKLIGNLNPSTTELEMINQCRLFLKAYYISDLATASGIHLSHHAWVGTQRLEGQTSPFNWPNQGTPSKLAWINWRKFLKAAPLGRGMRLRIPIGPWLRHDHKWWRWHYFPEQDGLIQITNGEILIHKSIISTLNKNSYSVSGTPILLLPRHILKASIHLSKRNTILLLDTGSYVDEEPGVIYDEFSDYVEFSCIRNKWCYENLTIPNDYHPIIKEITAGDIWLVTDGSYHPSLKYGSAAWILEGKSTRIRISGQILTPGDTLIQSAYRSELSGILAAITVLNTFARFHNIQAKIYLHCECKSGLQKSFSLQPIVLDDSSSDLLKSIQYELQNTPLQWIGAYIREHQDDNTPLHLLHRPSQLNILVDKLAKYLLQHCPITPHHKEVHTNSWSIRLNGKPVVQDIDNILYNHVHMPTAKQYWIREGQNKSRHL
jgi:hypothetical protein